MSLRFTALLLSFLLTTPSVSQVGTAAERASQRVWSRGQMIRPESGRDLDIQKTRLAAIHQDAADLSSISASLPADLQQLQNGMLAKDLAQKLKKVEKLAKKLRQEMTP